MARKQPGRLYRDQNVYDAALRRIGRIFDEFPTVRVNFSGGKDSTVIFNLALQVARERGRLPLMVSWLDQEAEWAMTVEYVRSIMYREDVLPRWYQIPFQIFNATSPFEHWLWAWREEDRELWMRDKDPIAIHENHFGQTRFAKLFGAITAYEHHGELHATLAGVRAQESPGRNLSLGSGFHYRGLTAGCRSGPKDDHYVFWPIYDWSYKDIWKAIHDNGWRYNGLYDVMYQYGWPVHKMRVSNLHHETAVHQLFILQEIEPETYARLSRRIGGVDMAGKMGQDDYYGPKELPFMFGTWREYRDYLLEHLIVDPQHREKMRRLMAAQDRMVPVFGDRVYQVHITSILTNDWEGIKIRNFEDSCRFGRKATLGWRNNRFNLPTV